ncbi:MAG: hypothetical protein OXC63_01005, partial [Aestuariivita sp.]|nr:hypothetical protein [Aestuariivita sp.]
WSQGAQCNRYARTDRHLSSIFFIRRPTRTETSFRLSDSLRFLSGIEITEGLDQWWAVAAERSVAWNDAEKFAVAW